MTPSEYIKSTAATDHNDADAFAMSVRCEDSARMLHYVLGVGTEAGELQDAVKRQIAYNKPLDIVNVKEEIGDLLWYVARICDHLGITLEDCMTRNIEKLKARYPNKFTEHDAINRNLAAEREVLEQN